MDETIFAIVGNDTNAQRRYFDTCRRSEHLEPEKLLLLAILEDAIHLFQEYRGARDRAGQERFREVEDWFMREGNHWLFSFANVCELLALDPQYVRRGLLASADPQASTDKRARRTARREAAWLSTWREKFPASGGSPLVPDSVRRLTATKSARGSRVVRGDAAGFSDDEYPRYSMPNRPHGHRAETRYDPSAC